MVLLVKKTATFNSFFVVLPEQAGGVERQTSQQKSVLLPLNGCCL